MAANEFSIEAKLKITGVDAKSDLNAGTLKFDVDTSALKKLVSDAKTAADKVKAKFDKLKLKKLVISVNKNSLRSVTASIRNAIQEAVNSVNVGALAKQGKGKKPTGGKAGTDPFKAQARSANKAAGSLDKLHELTKSVNTGMRSLIKTLDRFTGLTPGAPGAKSAAAGDNASGLPIPAGAIQTTPSKLLEADQQAIQSGQKMAQSRVAAMKKMAAAGDRQAQQRLDNLNKIRKRVDDLGRKELSLQQKLSNVRIGGGSGGGGGGGGQPPGGFGATPPGGDFDKSKGSLAGLGKAMGQLEQKTRSGAGAMRELDDLAFEVGKKAAAFRGVAIAINSVVNAAQIAASFLIQFNDSLLELNKILQFSNAGLQNIGNQLFALAAATGVAVDQTTEIATSFARAGLSGRGYGSVVELTQNALMGLQGTTLDATQATTVMIQVIQQVEAGMRGLNKELITTSGLFDILGRAEDITASKATDVAAALKRSAASLFATGASLSEVTAIISVLQERTQRGGDVIGTALKTLAARTSNSASEASKALRGIGVATIDAQGKLRNTFDVLSDTADAFNLLTEAEQANIAVKTAGIRQVEVFRAALNDFNRVREVEKNLAGASGDAARKQAVEQQKLANVIQRTKNALLELVKSSGEGVLGEGFSLAIRSAEKLFRFFADLDKMMGGTLATFAAFVALFGAAQALIPLLKGIFKALQTFISGEKQAQASMKAIGDAAFQVGGTVDGKMNKALEKTASLMTRLNTEMRAIQIETQKAAVAAERMAQARKQAQAELGVGASPRDVDRLAGRIQEKTSPEAIAQRERVVAVNRRARAGDLPELVEQRRKNPELFSKAEIAEIDKLNAHFGDTVKKTTKLGRGLTKLRSGINRVFRSQLAWGVGLSVLSGALNTAKIAAEKAGDETAAMATGFLAAGFQAAAMGALIGGPVTGAIFGLVGALFSLVNIQRNNTDTIQGLQKEYTRLGIIQTEAGEGAALAGKMIEDAFKNVKKFQDFINLQESAGDIEGSTQQKTIKQELRGLTGKARQDKRAELESKFVAKSQEKLINIQQRLVDAFDGTAKAEVQRTAILKAASRALKVRTGPDAPDLAEVTGLKAGTRNIANLGEEQFNAIVQSLEDVLPPAAATRLRDEARKALAGSELFGIASLSVKIIDAQVRTFQEQLKAEVPVAKTGLIKFLGKDIAAGFANAINLDQVVAGALKENRRLNAALSAIAKGKGSKENFDIIKDITAQARSGKLVAGSLREGGAGSLDAPAIKALTEQAKQLGEKSKLASTGATRFGAALSRLIPQLDKIAGVDLAQASTERARDLRRGSAERQQDAFENLASQLVDPLNNVARDMGKAVDPLTQALRKFSSSFSKEVARLELATINAVTPQEEMSRVMREVAETNLAAAKASKAFIDTDVQKNIIFELNKLTGAGKRIGRNDDGSLSKAFRNPELEAERDRLRTTPAGELGISQDARNERILEIDKVLAKRAAEADETFGDVRKRFVGALLQALEDIKEDRITDPVGAANVLGKSLAAAGPFPDEAINQKQKQTAIDQVLKGATKSIGADADIQERASAVNKAKAKELNELITKELQLLSVEKQRREVSALTARIAVEELTGIRRLNAERQIEMRLAEGNIKGIRTQLSNTESVIAAQKKILASDKENVAAKNALADATKAQTQESITLEKALAEQRIMSIRSGLAAAQEASNEASKIADQERTQLTLRKSIARSLSTSEKPMEQFNDRLKENAESFRLTQAKLAGEVVRVNATITDQAEREARLKDIRDEATTATLEAAEAEAQIMQERREAVKQITQELLGNQQKQVDAQKAIIEATKAVASAFEAYKQSVQGAILATTEYNLNIALVATQNQRLLGGFTGLREQIAATQDVFRDAENAAREMGASEKTLLQIRRESIQQQLALFNQLLTEQRGLAQSFLTSSAEDQANLAQGLSEASGIADLLGGSFDAFKNLGVDAINDIGAKLLSLPQEMRQRVVEALKALAAIGGSVGGFTADELLLAMEDAARGRSTEGGQIKVDPLFVIQEKIATLNEEQARIATEQLMASNKGVEAAKQQLEQAEAQKDLTEIQLERTKEEGDKLRGKLGELRGDLKTTLLMQDQTNRTGFDAVTAAVNRVNEAVLKGMPEVFSTTIAEAIRKGLIEAGFTPSGAGVESTPSALGANVSPDSDRTGSTGNVTPGDRGKQQNNNNKNNDDFNKFGPTFFQGGGPLDPGAKAPGTVSVPPDTPRDTTTQEQNKELQALSASLEKNTEAQKEATVKLDEFKTVTTETVPEAKVNKTEISVDVQGEQIVKVEGFDKGVAALLTGISNSLGFVTKKEAEMIAAEMVAGIRAALLKNGTISENTK